MPSASSSAAASGSGSRSKGQLTAHQKKIYQTILSAPGSTYNSDSLTAKYAGVIEGNHFMEAINGLLRMSLLNVQHTERGNQYVAVTKDEASMLGQLDKDELMIYRQIKDASTDGIWTKALKTRTGLHQTIMTRTLKSLENKSLIKSVKSVKNPTRKIYMLSKLTPSVELSGGAWYTDNELDVTFIENLAHVCHTFICRATWPVGGDESVRRLYPAAYTKYLPTAPRVLEYLDSVKVSHVKLSVRDVQDLLETLVYDEKIEKVAILGGGAVLPSHNGSKGKHGESRRRQSDDSDDDDDDSDLPSASELTSKRGKGSSKHKQQSKRKRKAERYSASESSETEVSDSDEESEAEFSDESADHGSRKKRGGKRKSSTSKHSRSKKGRAESSKGSAKSRKRSRSRTRHSSSESDTTGSSESSEEDSSSADNGRSRHSSKSKPKKQRSRKLTPEEEDMKAISGGDDDYIDDGEGGYDASLYVYRALAPSAPNVGFTETPCSRCPVFDFCRADGPVNATCPYYSMWIDARLEDDAPNQESDDDGDKDDEEEDGDEDGGNSKAKKARSSKSGKEDDDGEE